MVAILSFHLRNTDSGLLNQRLADLQHYFNTILGSDEYKQLNSLGLWIRCILIRNDINVSQQNSSALPRQTVSDKNVSMYIYVRLMNT
jgi:hypothetical protein